MTYYRVIYKDGSHGAWSKNYDEIVKVAKFFGGRVETRTIEING